MYLGLLPCIAPVRVGDIVLQRLGTGELVVGTRRHADVAVAGDLAAEARDGAGD